MLGLGTNLLIERALNEARITFDAAVAIAPLRADAQTLRATALLELDDVDGAHAAFARALELAPNARDAARGLGVTLERRGAFAAADAAFRTAFAGTVPPVSGDPDAPLAVLALWSALGGNVPLPHVLDARAVRWTTLFAEAFDAGVPLPPHDLVFNAIGNADLCGRALERAERIIAASGKPAVNAPQAVRATGRVAVARVLGALEDVIAPRTLAFDRAALAAAAGPALLAASGFDWPVLLRSPYHHNGEHFVRVAAADELAPAAAALPGERVLAIAFLDARGPDGNTRKYRAIFAGGTVHPAHLAISASRWKVHYATSDMAASDAFLDEERAYLADLPAALGARATAALERIRRTLGLDYGGIDFGLDADGRVLVFEANPTMTLAAPPPGARAAPRRAAIERIRAALTADLARRAR